MFKRLWHDFLKSTGIDTTPMFYQYVNNIIFQKLISHQYVRITSPAMISVTKPLTRNACNAFCYIAGGYVCNKVKIISSKHIHKKDMLLGLLDLCDKDDKVNDGLFRL